MVRPSSRPSGSTAPTAVSNWPNRWSCLPMMLFLHHRPQESWRSMPVTGRGWDGSMSSGPSGRHFPLQPHFGVNRIATWAPSTSTTINTNGMPRTAVGTAATPTLATTNLSTSTCRWRMTSAATAGAAAEERSAGWVRWRGNAEGLGGFTYVNRLSLVTLQATGMGFFGLDRIGSGAVDHPDALGRSERAGYWGRARHPCQLADRPQ